MQFKVYDVLASLIPGMLVLSVMIPAYILLNGQLAIVEEKLAIYKEISGILTSVFLVLSYLAGYLIHALGSWMEPFLFFSWGGRPSEYYFKKQNKRIRIVDIVKIYEYLVQNLGDKTLAKKSVEKLTKEDLRRLFQHAKNLANLQSKDTIKERLHEFNNSYVFSRNILVAFSITVVIILILLINKIVTFWLLVVALLLLLLLWLRCRDRAFYYSREVLVGAYYSGTHSANEN